MNKKKKYLDEIKAIPKEKSMGYYAPKASEINGIPTHNLPEIEIIAKNPYKLTDYQKAQASKITDNFRRGQYLKEQDYYNRTGKNKFTDDIRYIGTESQKRLANIALATIPGVGTVQPFIKYEDGKIKRNFSKEAFIQSGINTVLDFVPVGDLISKGGQQILKHIKPYILNNQLNKHINNIPLESSITLNGKENVETLPIWRDMLNDTKTALEYQIAPRLKTIKPNNAIIPIDRRLETISSKQTKIVPNKEINSNKVANSKIGGFYNPNTKEIVLPIENMTSAPIETHEASHAITHNIGSILNNRRRELAYNILGELKDYAKGTYDNVISDSKQRADYEIDEFIADVNAVRQKILKDVGAEKKDIRLQNRIFETLGADFIIEEFANISKYGKDFIEKYKDDPTLGLRLTKALQYLSATSGVIATQNNNKQ